MLNYGKCINIGICSKANNHELTLIVDANTECPECYEELYFAAPRDFSTFRRWLPILMVFSLVGLGGLWAMNGQLTAPKTVSITQTKLKKVVTSPKKAGIIYSTQQTSTQNVHKPTQQPQSPTLTKAQIIPNKPVPQVSNEHITFVTQHKPLSLHKAHYPKHKYKKLPDRKKTSPLQANLSDNKMSLSLSEKQIPETVVELSVVNKPKVEQSLPMPIQPKTIHRPDNLQVHLEMSKKYYLQPKHKIPRIIGRVQTQAPSTGIIANCLSNNSLEIEMDANAIVSAAK